MDSLLPFLERYGYAALGIIVFLEAIGFPVPAAPALLAVGAASAKGLLSPYTSFAVAITAMLPADVTLFRPGRTRGWWLLGLLCRLSMNPEACIYSSAAYFHRRGRAALMFAKFFPGINTMAPPMAGSMNMSARVFLRYDFVAETLYILAYGLLGNTFHTAIAAPPEWVVNPGRMPAFPIPSFPAAYFPYPIVRAPQLQK